MIPLLLILAVSNPAADDPRALFEQARTARVEGRTKEAERLLRRALEKKAHLPIAFNLASVLIDLGSPTEALKIIDGIRKGVYGPVDNNRRRVDDLAIRARTVQGRIKLQIRGLPASLSVNGRKIGIAANRHTIALDPGSHLFELSTGTWTATRTVVLEAGEELDHIWPGAPITKPQRSSNPEPPQSSPNMLETPTFWIVTSVIVLVGASVGIAFAVGGGEEDPIVDPIWGNVGTRYP